MKTSNTPAFDSEFRRRYQNGEWRSGPLADVILSEMARFGPDVSVLDIGCGHGFDSDGKLQQKIAEAAGCYVGVEPDSGIEAPDYFSEVHRSAFERAPIPPSSVDVAFSVMVLEHVERPQAFWEQLHQVLKPDGVFWGFTVDARHPFALFSSALEVLKIKDKYLNWLFGNRGADRYENYPVFYRANSVRRINQYTSRFQIVEIANLGRPGDLSWYFPRALKPVVNLMDRGYHLVGFPGLHLLCRMVK